MNDDFGLERGPTSVNFLGSHNYGFKSVAQGVGMLAKYIMNLLYVNKMDILGKSCVPS